MALCSNQPITDNATMATLVPNQNYLSLLVFSPHMHKHSSPTPHPTLSSYTHHHTHPSLVVSTKYACSFTPVDIFSYRLRLSPHYSPQVVANSSLHSSSQLRIDLEDMQTQTRLKGASLAMVFSVSLHFNLHNFVMPEVLITSFVKTEVPIYHCLEKIKPLHYP